MSINQQLTASMFLHLWAVLTCRNRNLSGKGYHALKAQCVAWASRREKMKGCTSQKILGALPFFSVKVSLRSSPFVCSCFGLQFDFHCRRPIWPAVSLSPSCPPAQAVASAGWSLPRRIPRRLGLGPGAIVADDKRRAPPCKPFLW